MESTDQSRITDPDPGGLEERVRTKWIREFREALDPLLDAWFPRCIDHDYGGFLCDFDYRWKPTGPHRKMLEFQARQTRLAAVAAEFFPDRPFLDRRSVKLVADLPLGARTAPAAERS